MKASRRRYFDHAAATPPTMAAMRVLKRTAQAYGNPSSPHHEGREASKILEESRGSIARLLEVRQENVIFTAGATEANNLALMGTATKGAHVLYLPTQHASVIQTIEALSARGVTCEPLVISEGRIDCAALQKQLRPETVLVSVDAVCGETGTRWNVRDVKRVLGEPRLQEGRGRVLLHVDASQLPRVESIVMNRFGADFMSLDAQKIGGVRGIGTLIVRTGTPLAPILFGGGQEHGLRPGTQSPMLAAAFAAALIEAQGSHERFSGRAASLLRKIEAAFPEALVNHGAQCAPHIRNLSFAGVDTDYLAALLDRHGIAVSTRSACETDAEGSRAVFVLTNDHERAGSTLRISIGPEHTSRDVDFLIRHMKASLLFIRANTLG